MITPPCKDCEFRTIGCHSNCEPYKEFQAEIEKIRKAADERFRRNDMLFNVERPQSRHWGSAKRQKNDITKNRK